MTSDTSVVRLREVHLSYGRGNSALSGLNLDVASRTITGLIGRNGAGKSSLMRVISGREARFRGDVTVLGNPVLRSTPGDVHLSAEHWPYSAEMRLLDLMRHLQRVHDSFDEPRALELLDCFGVNARRRAASLSRGQRSAAYASLALASRAPVTLLDEPHLGLDAPSRTLLSRAIVEEQSLRPRAMVISTHLIDESSSLFERVVVLDQGRVGADADVDQLCEAYVRVEGDHGVVASLPTLQTPERLGGSAHGVVLRTEVPPLTDVRLTSISLQELSGALTTTPGRLS